MPRPEGDLLREARRFVASPDGCRRPDGSVGDPSLSGILERRTAEIISRLRRATSQADQTLGYLNGELRFWLCRMGARSRRRHTRRLRKPWGEARAELEALSNEQSRNWSLLDESR